MRIKKVYNPPNGKLIVTDEKIGKNIYNKNIKIGNKIVFVKGVSTSDFNTIFVDKKEDVHVGDKILI